MNAVWRNRLIGLVLAVLVYFVDQRVKDWIVGPLQLRSVRQIDLLPFFDLTFAANRGVSMGMFEAGSPESRWILVGVTALIALAVFIWMLRERLLGETLALGLVLGGALGNIHDRYVLGYVIDYADFHIGSFRPFFIFNLADAAISIGVVIILARALFLRDKESTEKTDSDTAASAAAET